MCRQTVSKVTCYVQSGTYVLETGNHSVAVATVCCSDREKKDEEVLVDEEQINFRTKMGLSRCLLLYRSLWTGSTVFSLVKCPLMLLCILPLSPSDHGRLSSMWCHLCIDRRLLSSANASEPIVFLFVMHPAGLTDYTVFGSWVVEQFYRPGHYTVYITVMWSSVMFCYSVVLWHGEFCATVGPVVRTH